MKHIYPVLLYSSLTLLFVKGIQYLLIGSITPIVLSLLSIIVIFTSRKSKKKTNMALKFWSILIISWSVMRICIGFTDTYFKELTENHIQENMDVFGYIMSFLFLFIGVFLIIYRKNWLEYIYDPNNTKVFR